MVIKLFNQLDKDKGRRTFKVVFPGTATATEIEDWLVGISGSLNESMFGLLGTYAMTLEVESTSKGFEHRLLIPWQRADQIIGLLRSAVPGVEVTEGERPTREWTRVMELREANPDHTLAVDNSKRLSNALLDVMQPLKGDEVLLMQWVFTASTPRRKPTQGDNKDELADRRDKLAKRGLKGVLRLAALSSTDGNAKALIGRVLHVMAGTATAHNRITRQWGRQADLRRHVNDASLPLVTSLSVTLSEFVGLSGIPIEGPSIPGLAHDATRALAPTAVVAKRGLILGVADYNTQLRPVAVPLPDTARHVYIVGGSGMGKSTALTFYAEQLMYAGHGVVLIEASGDLFPQVIDRIPASRLNDVIVFDVRDTEFPIGFNLLQQGDSEVVIEELAQVLSAADGQSTYNDKVLLHALKTLTIDPGSTLVDLEPLIDPLANQLDWHESLKRRVSDPAVAGFWQSYDNLGPAKAQELIRPTLNRTWRLTSRSAIKNIIGQAKSSFTMQDVVRGNKILLVNLRGVPPETANIMGTLLVNALWRAVRETSGPRMNHLILDEFHQFLSLGTDPQVMFSEARKHRLGMIVAHQYLGQLSTKLKESVMANAGTVLALRVAETDGNALSAQFGKALTAQELINLKFGHGVTRLQGTDGSMNVVTIATPPPSPSRQTAQYIRDRSRYFYGRQRTEVEQSFMTRYYMAKPSRRKPTRDTGWTDIIGDDSNR